MGGGVDAMILFSTVEGGGCGGEKGQGGEGRHSGGGMKERIGREAAGACSGSSASGHDCGRGTFAAAVSLGKE